MLTPVLAIGISLAIISGLMNGTFTLPMRFLGRWSWENVWAVFIATACLVMPFVVTLMTVSAPGEILHEAPTKAVVFAIVTGFAWGFGSILFGQGVSAMGISMANTLVAAISSALGALLPILILAPERLGQPQGKAIVLGTIVAVVGIASCGYGGMLKERSQKDQQERVRGNMVGVARPFWIGLLLCTGSGVLSAVFNIGYSSAMEIVDVAGRLGNSAFAGSNLVWFLMLTAGAVPNLCFCAYLFKKNGSWTKFSQSNSLPLWSLAILMGLLWGGSIFVYGSASPRLGKLGPAIGWPLSLTVGLVTANVCGIWAGEWKHSGRADRLWMTAGLVILVGAIVILGWSGTLA